MVESDSVEAVEEEPDAPKTGCCRRKRVRRAQPGAGRQVGAGALGAVGESGRRLHG